jgi:transposase
MRNKNKKKPERVRLPKTEYDKLRRSAYELVVVQGMTQKVTAGILGVSEVTMSDWARDGKWKEEREARQTCTATDVDNIRKIIGLLAKQRYELETDIAEAEQTGKLEEQIALRKRASSISDEISKHNKTLLSLEKDNKATLGMYIDIFDDIFTALRQYDEDLFNQSIPFQTLHIRRKTSELG